MAAFRKDVIRRAFEIIELFDSGPVTTKIVRRRLGVCKYQAQKWINAYSLISPIYEDGLLEDGKTKVYRRLTKN